MKKLTYNGLLSLHNAGESSDVLFLSSIKPPLAEELEIISNKNVTVRYWITDVRVSHEVAEELVVKEVCGVADVNFTARYSEMTGYLWTDEDLNIGGHDLLAELASFVGKWLIIDIEIN